MENNKNVNIEKSLTLKKIYINENDNTSTDITERLNDSKKNPQEKIIGNYNIENVINKSITNKVVIAKHIITGEKVAIKILNKKSFIKDILSLKRIKKEVQILKMIKHENLINLLEIIENKNKIYLITDYYPNQLLSLIIKNKKLPETTALNYFNQIINGLYYLNKNGICHRNIRPDNLLLDEDNQKIKIIDFGLSTTYSKNQLLNSLVGEIIYAPPEMHLSEKYSGELIDIWKAGLVLYIMVCGYLPFSEEDEEKNINHIITGFYEIPSDISSNCAFIIKSCLQVDPNKRINFEQLNKYFNYTKGLIMDINIIPLDDIIIEECKKYLGNSNNQDIIEQIKESVKNNKFNEFNALYYLVMKKMIKNGYESISDLSSEKFKDYIESCEQEKEFKYYEKKKLSNFLNKKKINKYNQLNKSYNSTTSHNRNSYNDYSSNILPYKNQFIYSPKILKSINNRRSSSLGRNDSKIRSLINSNNTHCNSSCKDMMLRTNIKFDNGEKSHTIKVDCFKSVSPKVILNKKNIFFQKKNYYEKKNLLGAYSYWKNSRLNPELINRCNSCENNLTDSTINNNNNNNNSKTGTNNIHLFKNTKMPSNRIIDKKNYNSCGSIDNLKNFCSSKQKDKNRRTVEIIEKIRGTKINKNKFFKDKKKRLCSEKNNTNIVDDNNDPINILTEDKPIENFNVGINNNNKYYNFSSNNNIKISNYLNIKKYNDYYCKKNTNSNNGHFSNKLKVKKNTIVRGRTTIFKNGFKIKRIVDKKDDNIKIFNGNSENIYNLSYKNSFKTLKKNNNLRGTISIHKNNNNKSFNSNVVHKKNNSALLITLFDYKNTKDYLYDNDKDTERKIKNYNYNKNISNINKTIEFYETNPYNIGVFDLCCLKIDSINKTKEKINKVLKNKKVNFNRIKNNKYRCSKLGSFFDVDVFSLENFLSLNNRLNKNFEKENLFTKRINENKKTLCYLSFHIKKRDMKKSINSIVKDILI